MPNSERSTPYTIHVRTGSQTHRDIEADLANAPIGQSNSVLVLRLRDHYDAVREGRYLPHGWTLEKLLRMLSPAAAATLAAEAMQPSALPQWQPSALPSRADEADEAEALAPSVSNATDDDLNQWLS